MKGLLVRVGIDSTDGGWNAPVHNSTREFAYVTITETKPLRSGHARLFEEFCPALSSFGAVLPCHLRGSPTHLDPDFEHLTYGDQGQRAAQIRKLGHGDFLAFFAALQPTTEPRRPLLYALIGLFVIESIIPATDVPPKQWRENAHTRRVPGESDIVVRARAGASGRLRQCIPIGEFRSRSYRVRSDLLDEWGGVDVKDGFIQRSARLPVFSDPEKFYRWFRNHNPQVITANNPKNST